MEMVLKGLGFGLAVWIVLVLVVLPGAHRRRVRLARLAVASTVASFAAMAVLSLVVTPGGGAAAEHPNPPLETGIACALLGSPLVGGCLLALALQSNPSRWARPLTRVFLRLEGTAA